MHSLPGKYGIGTMGSEAYAFIDFLYESKQKYWQICPIGHLSDENSPYISRSAFAGNPLLISIGELFTDGYITEQQFLKSHTNAVETDRIDYKAVKEHIFTLLRCAYGTFKKESGVLSDEYRLFVSEQSYWLNDYATFIAHSEHEGTYQWCNWNSEPDHSKLPDIQFYVFVQFVFFTQWNRVKEYAHQKGIQIIGDIPIYIDYESSDVWAHRQLFDLDEAGRQIWKAGVPPDYFSATGQLWGNPTYNWAEHKKSDFNWWIQVLKHLSALYDLTRLDHFRGFVAGWKIPATDTTAEHGHWANSLGKDLFKRVAEEIPSMPFIVEDLGLITPAVNTLKNSLNLPGMKILQFTLEDYANNMKWEPFTSDTIFYTGTHDNDTSIGWFNSLSPERQKSVFNSLNRGDESEIHWAMIHHCWTLKADLTITTVQDLIGASSETRHNTPGKHSEIYLWKLKESDFNDTIQNHLLEITQKNARG